MKIKLIFLMIGIGCALHAQSFTKDKEKFCKEWNKFELDSKSSNFCKSELKNLLASPQISDTKFSKLVDVCNNLEKKGIPVNADVFNYMLAFIYQYVNKFDSEFTQEWAEIFVENLENKPDELSDFLLFSANLFRYKSLAKEAEYGWYYRKGNFEWVRNKKIQLICKDGELTCLVPVNETIGDSIKIVSTDGVFDLATKRWEGKGGVLSWEKVNGKNNETYANLNNYKVDFNKAILKADSVALSTPYFEKPILGKLIDKTILDLAESEKAPQFISFGHLKIPNLRENVDYVGSFVLEGGEFVGKGVDGRPAKMFFKVSDKIQVEIASQAFQMSKNTITSNEGSLKLHYKSGDSLSLQKGFFSYNLVRKDLKITAGVVGGVTLPFWDSHFNVYIKAPVLVWNGNNNTASFTFDVGTSQEQKYAIIESKDNYDGKLYAKYKPANSEHPFQLIAKKVVSTGLNEFGEGEIATAMNKIIDQIKPLIVDMMSDGFVQYNGTSKKIKVEQKLMDYVLAQNGQKDFDNLTIVSDFRPIKISISEADIQNNPELREERNNIMARNNKRQLATAFATIKIDDLELKMTEVDKVVFSENQNVVAYCDSADLIMKKNRDMYFKGWVTAGKMDIFCKNAVFDYENFKVSILSSRDAYFNFYPIKSDDGNKPIASPSSISHFSGEILIDLPSSRSGKMSKIDAYPMLISRVNTKVYYNDKSILKSAYDSTRFYYEIWPFELDSLDNFNEKSLAFDGELFSGGIFPRLKEKLVVMNDYSLGFFMKAPEEGLPFYGTETTYKNKIALSNNGLQGSGTIEFLEAKAISKLLTFLPDSTVGIAQFTNKERGTAVQFPEANCPSALISYQPKQGVLRASSYNGELISMFNKEITLTGSLVIQKSGATGSGLVDFKEASLEAKEFKFSNEVITSENSNFELRNRFTSYGENPLAIQSDGVKAFVSFKQRIGEFNSSGSRRIKFPANNYFCQMDKFIWKMDGDVFDFEKNGQGETNFESDADLVNNNFYSLAPEQDSLQFKSLNATYDLKTHTIICKKVEFIQIGDARIFPDSMILRVRKAAKLDPLKNAVISANYITKFHKFIDANVTISSRLAYEGNCQFPYYDKDSILTVLALQSIHYDKDKKETVAVGDIPQNKKFMLSKEFDFYGKLVVRASNPYLFLTGSTRVNHNCTYDKTWFNFSDTINPKKIQIPVNQGMINSKNELILSGFAWRNSLKLDSLQIYSGFLSKKENDKDIELTSAHGYVQFNDLANEFQIGSKERLQKRDTLSSLLSLHLGTCSLTGIGAVNIGINFGGTTLKAYGKLEYNSTDKKTTSNLNIAIDMSVPREIMEVIADRISSEENLTEMNIKAGKYGLRNNLAYWMGDGYEKIFKEYDEDKLRKMPDQLQQTFFFSGIRLESLMGSASGGRKAERGLITDKNSTVGLVSIAGIPILREVNTQIFFAQRHSSDASQFFGINFDLNEENFYYLNYQMDNQKESTLSFLSNDSNLKKSILAIKTDKRKVKNFKFELAEGSDATKLIVKFKSAFQNR